MKKIKDSKSKGNMGEALFESYASQIAIPHKIEASKDLGIDYICEYKFDEKPTGIMFASQIKYYTSKKPRFVMNEYRLNGLPVYKIKPSIIIKKDTLEYWKLLGLPVYLFVFIPNGREVDLFYKRYTPILNGKAIESRSPFYKANDKMKFLAFSDDSNKQGGFTRDLYIDQIRTNYSKGMLTYFNPRKIGLNQFSDRNAGVYFADIFKEYYGELREAYEQLKSIFENDSNKLGVPSKAPAENND